MAIANGTYIIVCAGDPTKAIDVSGNSDVKGANVQIWSRNGKSGQYVTVTGSGERQVLHFPLTGKVLDVYDAKPAATQNIIQWVGNNGNGQAWNIVATGRNVTVSGTSYPTYYIETALTSPITQDHLVVALKNSQMADGTNVQLLYYRSGNLTNEWAFIPVPLLPQGEYCFVSNLAQIMSLEGAPTSSGTVYAAGSIGGYNRQIWTIGNSSTGTSIRNYESKGYLAAPNDFTQSALNAGVPVGQSPSLDGLRTLWLLTVSGSVKYEGATYPLVLLRCGESHEYVVDVGDRKDKFTSNAKLYTTNATKGQQFIAIPAYPVDTSIPAPSVKMAYHKGDSNAYANIWGTGATTAYPKFESNYSQFQLSYRQRVRKATAGDSSFSSWSSWMCYGNDTSNEGWGDVTKPNISVEKIGGSWFSTGHTYTLSTTGNDLIEYQIRVRAISGRKLGNYSTLSGRYVYQPTCTVISIGWTPSGLSIWYTADQKRNNNDMVIYSVTCAHEGRTRVVYDGGTKGYPVESINYNGIAYLPSSAMKFIPSEGDSVTVTFRYTNVDGAYKVSKQTATKNCAYGSRSWVGSTPTVQVNDGEILHVDSKLRGVKQVLWVDYNDGTTVEMYENENGVWDVPIQLGKPYTVRVMAYRNGQWEAYSKPMEARHDDGVLFNFVDTAGNQRFVKLKYNSNAAPTIKRSISYDNDIQLTNSNAMEVVHFGNGRSESLLLEGVMPLTWYVPNSSVELFEQLGLAHYAWFRSAALEGLFRVAITNIDFDMSVPDRVGVSLSITRIEHPTDWYRNA